MTSIAVRHRQVGRAPKHIRFFEFVLIEIKFAITIAG